MFLFPDHQERFEQFTRRDGTHPKDIESKALFYVLAGCRDLFIEADQNMYKEKSGKKGRVKVYSDKRS